ncbi:MAG: NFACT RNA binding domain-containing protein [Chloroflexi bacterium]|nr:NFACT RNA binding domain-containing protein [Chloroflexota bacterium]MCY4247948.1 NFACT RNA binding domain-containing protein [Chloroflexota bacterium]
MSPDTFAISALVDELRARLPGGRVQDVIDVAPMSLGLEVYAQGKRHYLLLCADSQQPRAHLVDSKLRRGAQKPTQLGLLFRRYVEGGRIATISQPAWERLLEIDVDSEKGRVRIIAELMPRRANLLLVRAGIILDCLNRVGPDDNRYRLSLPKHRYVPPPPIQNQLDPATVAAADLQRILASADKPTRQVRRLLPGRILGMSPLLASEIVFRATGDSSARVGDIDGAGLLSAFDAVMQPLLTRHWQPGMGRESNLATVFAACRLTHVDWQPCGSISEAMAAVYGELAGSQAYDEARKPVQAALLEAKAKLPGKLESLRQGLRDESERERLRQCGELILAYQYAIAAGQSELRAQYDFASPELVVRLDERLTPLENAQAYFRRYDKAKAAARAVPALIAQTEIELAYIEQLEADLANAANWLEIDDVIQSLQARGHWQGARLKRLGGGGRQGPLRIVSRDGYVLWVGRNSRQNAQLTFKRANPQDIWLHARDVPGAHVVIRDDGRRIKEELLRRAAAVAAHYSRRRSDSRVQVDYTRVKYVRAIKGAGPGMVAYRNEKSLWVRPRDESILA